MSLRASEGLAAVDFLMPGYFVWGKIIEALADLGYEPNTLVRTRQKTALHCLQPDKTAASSACGRTRWPCHCLLPERTAL